MGLMQVPVFPFSKPQHKPTNSWSLKNIKMQMADVDDIVHVLKTLAVNFVLNQHYSTKWYTCSPTDSSQDIEGEVGQI